jgi:hypothetical protein
MNELNLTTQILATCRKVRGEGQYLDIDFMLPSLLYFRNDDFEYHFREHDAQKMLDHYRPLAEQTGLPLRDVLLWAAQGWDLSGDRLTFGGLDSLV